MLAGWLGGWLKSCHFINCAFSTGVYCHICHFLHGLSIERLSTANHCFGSQASHNELNISCGFTAARIQFNIIVICVRIFHSWCIWFVELWYVNTSFALLYWFSTHSHFSQRTKFVACEWLPIDYASELIQMYTILLFAHFQSRFFPIKRMWKRWIEIGWLLLLITKWTYT